MGRPKWAGVALAACATILALSTRAEHGGPAASAASSDRQARLPPVMLWGWERSEDLRFINPKQMGVAYLDRTIRLKNGRVEVRPRMQPLLVPPGTTLLAVVRIESGRPLRVHPRSDPPPQFTSSETQRAVEAIAGLAGQPGLAGVQIDFDAAAFERVFYRNLLVEVRRRMPSRLTLSMTALASWCMGDDWIEGLPVDEAVPMLFRMGPDRSTVLNHLENGASFRARLCQESAGISTDEPVIGLGPRRYYIFCPQPWSQTAFDQIRREVLP